MGTKRRNTLLTKAPPLQGGSAQQRRDERVGEDSMIIQGAGYLVPGKDEQVQYKVSII